MLPELYHLLYGSFTYLIMFPRELIIIELEPITVSLTKSKYFRVLKNPYSLSSQIYE
jgi:hypothetical protein